MCEMKNSSRVNNARYEIVQKKNYVKGLDSSNIPPCWKSLRQKVLRTTFATLMWLNGTTSLCAFSKLEKYGWDLNETLKPTYFNG